MADKIFLQGSEINTKSIKKAISLLEKVARVKGANFLETSLNDIAFKMQMGVENSYGVRFLSNASEEAESIADELEAVAANLASLQKHLSDSPEVLEDADKSFKDWNDKREGNWFSRVLNSLFGTTIGGYLSDLFGIQRNAPVETVLSDKINGSETADSTPSKELTQYEKYRASVNKANAAGMGEIQVNDWCTHAATATLLRRRQALDGDEPTYTIFDVRAVNSAMVWEYEYSTGVTSYQFRSYESSLTLDSITSLLDEHPEGVMVWAPSTDGNNHAIVITDYEISSNGTIQLFADDPVTNRDSASGRVPIEDTWLSKVNSDILGTTVRYSYIE